MKEFLQKRQEIHDIVCKILRESELDEWVCDNKGYDSFYRHISGIIMSNNFIFWKDLQIENLFNKEEFKEINYWLSWRIGCIKRKTKMANMEDFISHFKGSSKHEIYP